MVVGRLLGCNESKAKMDNVGKLQERVFFIEFITYQYNGEYCLTSSIMINQKPSKTSSAIYNLGEKKLYNIIRFTVNLR